MHPLRNGSQATTRPANKPLVGSPGYFTESGDNNIPSYPGADWFNHVIDEFQNALAEMGVTFDPTKDDHLQKMFSGVNLSINDHINNATNAHKASAISLALKSILGNEQFSLQNVSDSFGVFVEEFRAENDSDSDAINKALNYIGNLPFTGTRLVFKEGYTYEYDTTHYLGGINNLTLDLNGATLKRVDGVLTSSTLDGDIGTGQAIIWLTRIPDTWHVGDYLTAFSDVNNDNTSQNPVKILEIDKLAKKVTLVNGFGSFGSFTSIIPSGTTVAKCFQCFSGRPSAPDPGSPFNPGINERIFIINGVLDGNSANQLNYSWRFIHEIGLHSKGGLVSKMHIKNVAGESIVGHGITVDDNVYENLNGSCFHLSLNDLQKDKGIFSRFINNNGKGVNLRSTDVGHSEGMITFSWGAGNLIIEGNIIKNGGAAIIGEFGPKTEENADRLLIMGVNIFENFQSIMHDISPDAEGVHIHDTVFVSCGLENSNNYAVTTSILKNASCSIRDCTYINTDANKAEEALSQFIGSNIDKLTSFNKLWVQQRDIGSMSYDILEARVLEGGSDAYVDEDDKDTTIGYYKKNGSQFSEYFELFSRILGLKQFRGNNTVTAFEFVTGYSTDIPSLRIEKDGTVQIPLMRKLILGNMNEDGSWLFDATGGDLLIQKKVGGAWVTKNTITG